MNFTSPLIHGKLINRYKRFLADIQLDSGEIITANCTNSGSMKSCIEIGAEVYLSPANNPLRRTQFTWEMIKINDNWVGINTNNPNTFAFESITNQIIAPLCGYNKVSREVTFANSRFDIVAQNEQETCIVEVKNVTYKHNEFALFPDAKTTRGLKHLHGLMDLKKEGYRCVMLYIIQRMDVDIFAPAVEIDPDYANGLILAEKQGVEIIPVEVKVTPQSIEYVRILPYVLK